MQTNLQWSGFNPCMCFCWPARKWLVVWSELSVTMIIVLTIVMTTTDHWTFQNNQANLIAFICDMINVACSGFLFFSICVNNKKLLWASFAFVMISIINLLSTCIIILMYINGAIEGVYYDPAHVGSATAYTVSYYVICIILQCILAYTTRLCILEIDYELKQNDTPFRDFS